MSSRLDDKSNIMKWHDKKEYEFLKWVSQLAGNDVIELDSNSIKHYYEDSAIDFHFRIIKEGILLVD